MEQGQRLTAVYLSHIPIASWYTGFSHCVFVAVQCINREIRGSSREAFIYRMRISNSQHYT